MVGRQTVDFPDRVPVFEHSSTCRFRGNHLDAILGSADFIVSIESRFLNWDLHCKRGFSINFFLI